MIGDIILRAVSQRIPQLSVPQISLKCIDIKFDSNFPGDNELGKLPDQVDNLSSVGHDRSPTSP